MDFLVRTILIVLATVALIRLEVTFNVASIAILGFPLWTVTLLFLLVVWGISIIPLLLLGTAHATH